jgi:hypothetical protein
VVDDATGNILVNGVGPAEPLRARSAATRRTLAPAQGVPFWGACGWSPDCPPRSSCVSVCFAACRATSRSSWSRSWGEAETSTPRPKPGRVTATIRVAQRGLRGHLLACLRSP